MDGLPLLWLCVLVSVCWLLDRRVEGYPHVSEGRSRGGGCLWLASSVLLSGCFFA